MSFTSKATAFERVDAKKRLVCRNKPLLKRLDEVLYMSTFGSIRTFGLHNPLVMVLISLSLDIPFFTRSRHSRACSFELCLTYLHLPTTMQDGLVNVVPTLPRITVILGTSPERQEVSSVGNRQRLHSSTTSTWSTSFGNSCCSIDPTDCCLVICCPCTTIASIEESLGGSYDRTLLYFGGLALGCLLSIAFASSSLNHSNERLGSSNCMMWKAIAAVLFMTFLVGVWRLRAQARHRLGIRGSQCLDCLSSFFCCFCVVSQLNLELKDHYGDPRQHYRRSQGDNPFASTGPADTLAPYVAV